MTPAAANCSASCSVDTAAGPWGVDITRRATSMDLGVFRCGRSRTPWAAISPFRRLIFRVMRDSSSTRQGVSRVSRVDAAAAWVMKASVGSRMAGAKQRRRDERSMARTGTRVFNMELILY
ncbi:hypothetical protein D3C72_1904230 [compost metagenome]